MTPARLDPKAREPYYPPFKFIVYCLLIMVAIVVVLIVLSQTTGFMAMDYYNNGLWR